MPILAQLRTFCAVVDSGSFTLAGRVVHRTQSTVSTQIGQLEEAYGTPLLDRRADRVTATESGRMLYDYARRIISLADESREQVGALRENIGGEFVIGASTIPGTYILPAVAHRFRIQHPGVTVTVAIANSRAITQQVLEHRLEIGIIGEQSDDKRLVCEPVAADRLVLIVPPGHAWLGKKAVTLRMLAGEPAVSREPGSGSRAAVEAFLQRKKLPGLKSIMEVSSTAAVKESVRAGLGIGFVSDRALAGDTLKAVPVKGMDIRRQFYAVTRRGAHPRRAVSAFLEFLKQADNAANRFRQQRSASHP